MSKTVSTPPPSPHHDSLLLYYYCYYYLLSQKSGQTCFANLHKHKYNSGFFKTRFSLTHFIFCIVITCTFSFQCLSSYFLIYVVYNDFL